MKTAADLQRLLRTIDRKSYPAYKDTKGSYGFDRYMLSIDHVQGDPFASPSRVSIHVDGKTAGFPKECYERKERRIALQDHLLRLFRQEAERYNFKAKGSGKSGLLSVSRCGQEVLERTACTIEPETGKVIVRVEIGFPANGRTICSSELEKILFDFLPRCVQSVLFYRALDEKEIEEVLFLADDRKYIRDSLKPMGLAAFVANGSVLPRESGVSDKPMKGSVPFVSPASMEVAMELPHKGRIKGMGIREGITLIVGGGYHGKSTLLKALELGVYDHIAGDGREYVITVADGMKIRAEDGRCVKKDDISMFVNNLPNGKKTRSFYTEDASGSTSQAANVIEAMESGSTFLLIDEDTCATNFMVRDELMQRVVHRDKEPITPFIERARYLYEKKGISCIMVAGSSGAYFHIADQIVQMDNYVPCEITAEAKAEAAKYPVLLMPEQEPEDPDYRRSPTAGRQDGGRGRGRSDGGRGGRDDSRVKIKGMGKEAVSLNKETINLHYVEQIADSEQVMTLGHLLAYAESNMFNGKATVQEIVDRLMAMIEDKGLGAIVPGSYLPSGLALPRRQEIFACFNRYRKLGL
ncbi:MAG: ABC-ATPase domain-containing protein [Lachnospiraceae bacterium]|nr:ABC-ATPase domain-containing protein [Lachnospiraceae bacterium]